MSQAKLVSWFGDGGDPLLPENLGVEVKPFLRELDEHQTYDRVFTKKSSSQLFDEQSDFHVIKTLERLKIDFTKTTLYSPLTSNELMVERFVPNSVKWCNDYSTKIFELFSAFQRRSSLNFTRDFFDSNFKHYFSDEEYRNKIFDIPEIKINKDEYKWITISWLEFDLAFTELKRQSITFADENAIRFNPQNTIALFSVVIDSDNSDVKDFIQTQFNFLFLWDSIKDENLPNYIVDETEPKEFNLKLIDQDIITIKSWLVTINLFDPNAVGVGLGFIFVGEFFTKAELDAKLAELETDPEKISVTNNAELERKPIADEQITVDIIDQIANDELVVTIEYANNNYWNHPQDRSNVSFRGKKLKPFIFIPNTDRGKLDQYDVKKDYEFLINHPIRAFLERVQTIDETKKVSEKVKTITQGFINRKKITLDENYETLSFEEQIEAVDEYIWKLDENGELNFTMPDSIRIKEIHQALEAQKYATYESKTGEFKPRVANIGYYVERIGRLLGINVLPDGVGYKPKEEELKDVPDDGSPIDLPLPYQENRWGLAVETVETDRLDQTTDVANLEVEHDGFAYEIISNKFVEDDQTGEKTIIKQGGYGLINNIPQLMQVILDDLDKALGLQESGAFTIRSVEDVQKQVQINDPDNPLQTRTVSKPKLCTYEGLHSLLAEIAFMDSEISRRSSQAEIASLKTLAVCFELLGALGLPIAPKTFKAFIGTEEERGLNVLSDIYYPALKSDSPKITELISIVMENIAPLLGNQVTLPEEEQEKIKTMSKEELEEYINTIKTNIDTSSQNTSTRFSNQF